MKTQRCRMLVACATLGALAGCKITVVEGGSSPFPNAAQVQQRAYGQKDRIAQERDAQNINPEAARLLAQNDDLILGFMQEDRAPNNGAFDLQIQQAQVLNRMLDDNDAFIQDAATHRQAWADYFRGDTFDYGNGATPYLYLTYLDHQLARQEQRVDDGLRSGGLDEDDARGMRERIQVIRSTKADDYRSNGRLALSDDQVAQLSSMADDTARYIRFRLERNEGSWDQDKFRAWRNQAPQPMAQGQAPAWSGQSQQSGPAQGWARAQAQSQAPIPAQAAVQAPVSPGAPEMRAQRDARPTTPPASAPAPGLAPQSAAPPVPPSKPGPPRPAAPALVVTQDQLGQFFKHLDQNFQRGLKSGRIPQAQASDFRKRIAAIHQKAIDDQALNRAKNLSVDQMRELGGMAAGIK